MAAYWEADTSFGFGDGAAVDALDALADDVSGVPERASEEYQSRLFLESIANDSDPLVPIEVPMHHVEIVRALYKSAHEGAPVSLPLDKDDPFYHLRGAYRLTAPVYRRRARAPRIRSRSGKGRRRTAMTKYRAGAIGRTGRGDWGHGLDVAFVGLPDVDFVAVADDDPEGLKAARGEDGSRRRHMPTTERCSIRRISTWSPCARGGLRPTAT